MRQIKIFSQKENETFNQAWEIFKDHLLCCPHHGFEKRSTVSFFYDGLTPKMKKMIKTMFNGVFLDKNEDEVEEHFDWLTEHAPEWEQEEPSRSRPKSIN